jgi:hypothetical protein
MTSAIVDKLQKHLQRSCVNCCTTWGCNARKVHSGVVWANYVNCTSFWVFFILEWPSLPPVGTFGRLRFMKAEQSLQYHLPLGRSLIPTQSKWNHSILHCHQVQIQHLEQPPYKWPNVNSHCIKPVRLMQGTYLRIITSYHLAIGDLPTVAICGLIWVNRKVQLHVNVWGYCLSSSENIAHSQQVKFTSVNSRAVSDSPCAPLPPL